MNTNLTNHHIDYYKLSIEECLDKLQSRQEGLHSSNILEREKIYGKNILQELHKTPAWLKFLVQFKEILIILLMVSAVVSLYLKDYRGAIILSVIVLLNAIIGYVQEAKAEKIMQSLKKMLNPAAKVKRDNKLIEISAENLVPGDIVYIEEGNGVPADLRIIENMNLKANDFSLTGESNPVSKFTHAIGGNTQIAERNNLLFMGTTIATGHGYAIVIATGMNTELGRIAKLSHDAGQNEQTPLQIELGNIAKKLTIGTLFLCILLIILAIALKFSLQEAFVFAIGISAAMVPQGLPAQVSVALSLASGKLAKNGAIVKQLASVETLGCINIICTDKTGTLTKNEMTVKNVYFGSKIYEVTGSGYENNGKITLEGISPPDGNELFAQQWNHFFHCCILNNNARINSPDKEHATWYCIGDPTEGALVVLSQKIGFDIEAFRDSHENIHEFGFDSVRKMMSTISKFPSSRASDSQYMVYTKGAPKEVLDRCTQYFDGKTIVALDESIKKNILENVDQMAAKAMRNLGIAYKVLDSESHKAPDTKHFPKMDEAENNLVFLGFASIIDPPREEAAYAMAAAHDANIKVAMITGDAEITARAIGEQIGLIKPGKTLGILVGEEIKNHTDIQILELMKNDAVIFCRISPEDKLRIVGILKKNKNIVAVTGDGINDAPALKMANIGVSMGKIGTDVAKQASEIILLDDNFNTLVYAIREGRVIFQNLKKTIKACITSNGGELFAILTSLAAKAIFNIPVAITPTQILAIDLIGEMGPLASLAWDPAQENLMKEKPRNLDTHIMDKHIIIDLIWSGALMGIFGFAAYILYFLLHGIPVLSVKEGTAFYAIGNSITYVTIMFCQHANIFSRRAGGTQSAFTPYAWANKKYLRAVVISLALILLLVYNPIVSYYFGFGAMQMIDWIFPVGFGLLYLAIRELYKIWRIKHEHLQK